jgi:hypothetical protein
MEFLELLVPSRMGVQVGRVGLEPTTGQSPMALPSPEELFASLGSPSRVPAHEPTELRLHYAVNDDNMHS